MPGPKRWGQPNPWWSLRCWKTSLGLPRHAGATLAQREGRPITLTVSAPADLTIQGWPDALRDALTNLIFNAVDALPSGGTIQLTAQRQGNRAILEVRDSGIGISEEIQERIFEPFFTTKGERGTGLGLPTVYRIVERHGGTITVRSAPGRGTTFRLSLPLTTSEPASAAALSPAERLPGRRVLAVDDDPRLAEMARRMLELDGHWVMVATSGEEALALLATQAFDVVLSDLGLGSGMTGWDPRCGGESALAYHPLCPHNWLGG
ncbi:MAG: hypothetical protein KatS3mg061_3456 [Dehalococcoidia bacterium]|nr:MAG: hypothetical protein KatS3mg061_3456 [Dehalococcoidia bacterium]